MAELLSSAAAWMTGSGLTTPNGRPSSSLSMPIRGACAPELLEVAFFGPSLHRRPATAPMHFMGGGPRTYPGGVTKWQWKRMQLKKTRQIEKARLMREKHVYEARRRAELIAASPSLEMPWQKMSRVRPPNYISADEQVNKLAARFNKNGAEDLWTEKDGPERFEGMENNDDHLESRSSSWLFNTKAHNQDGNKHNAQGAMYADEQGNGLQDTETPSHFESLRHMPRIKRGSTPYPEPYQNFYQRKSWRPYS